MTSMTILTEAELRKIVKLDREAVACVENAFLALATLPVANREELFCGSWDHRLRGPNGRPPNLTRVMPAQGVDTTNRLPAGKAFFHARTPVAGATRAHHRRQ